MNLVYDVAHNIAKFEEHTIGGRTRRLWVHRKGATRAFPPDHEAYKDVSLVVDVVHQAGLAKKVARMRPVGVIKG